MEKLSNIELFNAIAGKIFADLYQNFPNEVEIDPYDFLKELINPEDYEGGCEISTNVDSTVRWLARAGYIWLSESKCMEQDHIATLAPLGLEILKSVPDSLESNESIGDKLVEFSKNQFSNSMSQIVKSAISEGIKLIG